MSGCLYCEEGRGLLTGVRRRYLLVKIDAEKIPERRDFENTLWYNVTRLFGEYGASRTELSIIEYDQEKGYTIIRCSHIALPMVRAAITAITKIGNVEAIAHTLMVSGTLKALKRRMDEVLKDKRK